MTHRLSFAVATAGLAGLAGLAIAAEDTVPRTEIQRTHQVVVLKHAEKSDGKVPAQIMVTSRSEDGAAPSMQVKLLGDEAIEAETIDVGSLEEGESRTFTTKAGKDVVVTRGEKGMTLEVDGKEIELPSVMNVSVLAAGEPGFATVQAWADGAGAAALAGDESVVMLRPHVMPFAMGNFDDLESLQDLDPEVRDKVVAALKEIFAAHHGTGFHFQTGAPGAAVPGHGVVMHRVVVDEVKEGGSKVE